MSSEIRYHADNKRLVRKSRIIGTNLWVYSAWERDAAKLLESPYRTLMHIDDVRYGKIGTDTNTRAKEAQELIHSLFFPETIEGNWDHVINEVQVFGKE